MPAHRVAVAQPSVYLAVQPLRGCPHVWQATVGFVRGANFTHGYRCPAPLGPLRVGIR